MNNIINKEVFKSENGLNKLPTAVKLLNKKINRSPSDVKSLLEKERGKEYPDWRYKTGRWKKDEHIRFLKGCFIYKNNWKKVKEVVKTRSSSQIRSHAQKYIIKLCKKYKPENINDDSSRCIEKEIIDNSNLTPENIELIILSIFKSDVYPIKKVLNIDYENLCFPEDLADSDYEDNSIDGKVNTKSGSSFELKNHENYKSNSFNVIQSNLEANDLFKASEFIIGNSEKSVEFRNLISLNIPGISDLNEKELNLLLMLNDETYFKNLMGYIEFLQRNHLNNISNTYNYSINNSIENNQVFNYISGNTNKIYISKDIMMDLESKKNSQNEKDDSSKFEDKIEINLEDVFLNPNNFINEEVINNLDNNINNDNPNKSNFDKKEQEEELISQNVNLSPQSNVEKNHKFENFNLNPAAYPFLELVNHFIQSVMKDKLYYNTRESDFNTKHLSWELIKNFLPNNKEEKNDDRYESPLELINNLFSKNFQKDKFTEEDMSTLKANLIDVNMLKKLTEFNEEEIKFKNYLDSVINESDYFKITKNNNANNVNNINNNLSQYGFVNNGINSLQNCLGGNISLLSENNQYNFFNLSNNNNNLIENQNLNLINTLINHNQNLEAVNYLNYINQISNLSSVPMNLCNYNNDLLAKLLLEQTEDVNNKNNNYNFFSNNNSNEIIKGTMQTNESGELNTNKKYENTQIKNLVNVNLNVENLEQKDNNVSNNFDLLVNLKNNNSFMNLEHKLTTFESAINIVDVEEDKKDEGLNIQRLLTNNSVNNFSLMNDINLNDFVNGSLVNNLDDKSKNSFQLRETHNTSVIETSNNMNNFLTTVKVNKNIIQNKDENSLKE